MDNTAKCNCNQQSHCRSEAAKVQTCPCRKCKEKRAVNNQLRGAILDQHRQGGGPGGANKFNNSTGGFGAHGFGNENANFCVTFLLEIVGILVFFAIATLMFWIGVCYYSFKIAIKIKNANRNTQYACAVLASVFLIFLMVTLVRNRTCADHKSCSKKEKPTPPPPKKNPPCSPCAAKANAKATKKPAPAAKCNKKPVTCPVQKCGAKPKPEPKPLQCAKCKAKAKLALPSMTGKSCKPKRVYSDCEGRRIYENSRRYAVPTEMKQPPSLLVYIQNWISERRR